MSEVPNGIPQPKKTWYPADYVKADTEAIKASAVDCDTCPVSMLCQASTGSSGFVCTECHSTSVFTDDNDRQHAYVIDCEKHTFPIDEQKKIVCQLCDGRTFKHEFHWVFPWSWILPTVHAKVGVEERQRVMREGYERWKSELTDEAQKKMTAKRRTEVNPFIK